MKIPPKEYEVDDDHVLLGSPVSSFTAHPYVIPNLPYRQDDLAPIARGWNVIIVIAVPASLPVNSIRELVEMAKAQPGKLNWAGTTGAHRFAAIDSERNTAIGPAAAIVDASKLASVDRFMRQARASLAQ